MFKISTRTKFFALFAALLASGSTFTGCYGSFRLSKKMYQVNGSIGNKWIKSLVTLLTFWNLYPVVGFVDVAVLNLVEFWTGSNPMASNSTKDFDQKLADGTRLQAHKLDDGRLKVTLTPVTGETKVVVLDREADGINANTVDGTFLAKVATAANGSELLITPKVN